jgi:hypothetical protein
MKPERPSSSSLQLRAFTRGAIAVLLGLALLCLYQLMSGQRAHPALDFSKAKDNTPLHKSERLMKLSAAHNSYESRLNQALTVSNPIDRSMNYGTLFNDWLKTDLEGALAYLQKLPQGAPRTQALFMALPYLAQTDPERALNLAATMAREKEELPIFNSLFAGITQNDPAMGLKLLTLAPAGEARENALRAVASTWASLDLSASIAWANSLSDPREKTIALQSSLSALIPNNPGKAIALAIEHLPEDPRQETIDQALRAALQDDPTSASQWLNQFSDNLPAALVPEAAHSLATASPETALKWLEEIPAGDEHNAALLAMQRVWSATDLSNAGRLIASSLSAEDQNLAAQTFTRTWAATDPTAAIQWSQSLHSKSAADAALLGAISGWAQISPEAATQWAATLPNDDARRASALDASLSYWVLSDPAAALGFVESLPAAEQERARHLFPSQKPVG